MPHHRICSSCRHWHRLSTGAVVGHCTSHDPDVSFKNEREGCSDHSSQLTKMVELLCIEQSRLAARTQSLVADAKTRVEIARQLAAEARAAIRQSPRKRLA